MPVTKLARITYAPGLLPAECQVSSPAELGAWLSECGLDDAGAQAIWTEGQGHSCTALIECYPLADDPIMCTRCQKLTAAVLTPDPTPWCLCQPRPEGSAASDGPSLSHHRSHP